MVGLRGVSFEEVRSAWADADITAGKPNTLGILYATMCYVTGWYKCPVTSKILSELRLIGGGNQNIWGQLSRGTFRVAECELPMGLSLEAPIGQWSLIALASPNMENLTDGQLVLIDGNRRAVLLHHRVQEGQPVPKDAMLYFGRLDGRFHFIAAAASSLWR